MILFFLQERSAKKGTPRIQCIEKMRDKVVCRLRRAYSHQEIRESCKMNKLYSGSLETFEILCPSQI